MKKIISVILAILMITASFVSYAAPRYENEPKPEEMEKMISIVKPKLDIPADCNVFDWYYNAGTYYRSSSWNFSWNDENYNKHYSVSCDNEGNITNFYFSDWSYEEKTSRLPAFTKEELKGNADKCIQMLRPDAFPHLVLTNSYAQIYSRTFNYEYTRFEDGVAVPEERAYVSVDFSNGKVNSFSISYNTHVTFGKKDNVGEEKAKELIKSEQNMILSYRIKRDYESKTVKAYLVYTPEVGYISVNAETGEICLERNTWNVQTEPRAEKAAGLASSDNAMFEADEGASDYKLTEEERAQVDLLDSLITKDEAVKAVKENKYLYIDNDATAVDAYLTKNYGSRPYYYYGNDGGAKDEDYAWRITFSAPYRESDSNEEWEKTGYFSPYMYALVNAKTGKIMEYRASVPHYKYYVNDYRKIEIPALKYDEESAKAIFEEFANDVIPEKMELSRYTDCYSGTVIDYANAEKYEDPVYRTRNFNYVRVNEGVDFDYNSISGEVDLVTGKITGFNCYWYDDVQFESPKDAISAEEALDVLLSDEGFGLNYEINSNYTYNQYLIDMEKENYDINELYETEQYSRLVYSGYNHYSTTVLALTGKISDYSGEEYTKKGDYNYTDIDSHWAKDDILMLADLGIGFEGDKFLPDEKIDFADFAYLANSLDLYSPDLNNDKYDEDGSEKTGYLTRTQAVKYIIDAAGYKKIAEMKNIFITDFNDNNLLDDGDVGYIAIARGFGFVQGDMNSFRPYDDITRAEAVTIILNYIRFSE
ncbi:MAG: S-layer homology domain-containing protein [Clostridiales bacterium]|nr:S-layer homology domain-containing protein [Clostridiales bacterium]